MKKIAFVLLASVTASCSVADTKHPGYPNRLTGPYLLGGDYYQTCNEPSVFIDVVSETTSTVIADCHPILGETFGINFMGCYVDSRNWIEVVDDFGAMWCDNLEPYITYPAISENAIAGDYWMQCVEASVTYARYTSNIYVPATMTATCNSVPSTLQINGNCGTSPNGFYEVTVDSSNLLECVY